MDEQLQSAEEYYIASEGEYNTGYATIESNYALEFGAHTSGKVLK